MITILAHFRMPEDLALIKKRSENAADDARIMDAEEIDAYFEQKERTGLLECPSHILS